MDSRSLVIEALGAERTAFFDQLIDAAEIEPGLVWSALLIQTFGIRLIAEVLDPLKELAASARVDRDDTKLMLTLSVVAQQMSIQETGRIATIASIDALTRSVRETREIVTAATATQRLRASIGVSRRTLALSLSAMTILAILICCISWSLAYQRGQRAATHSDAVFTHRDGNGWSRFVRHELGLK